MWLPEYLDLLQRHRELQSKYIEDVLLLRSIIKDKNETINLYEKLVAKHERYVAQAEQNIALLERLAGIKNES